MAGCQLSNSNSNRFLTELFCFSYTGIRVAGVLNSIWSRTKGCLTHFLTSAKQIQTLLSNYPRFPEQHCFWRVLSLRLFVFLVTATRRWRWNNGEMILTPGRGGGGGEGANYSKKFIFNKTNRRTNFPNLFRQETLHVSGSSSAHHQEFYTVHPALVFVMQVDDSFQARPGWNGLKAVINLHDIYQCRMYSGKLLMMGRGTARNM